MKMVFVHGAGGFDEDRAIADPLAAAVDAKLSYLTLPTEDMSFAAWGDVIGPALGSLSGDDVVVAHSFGASALMPLVAAVGTPAKVVLMAMPDWGPDGWDVEEYAWAGNEPAVRLSIHHCRDDEIVSFDHLALHRINFPSATFHEHTSGGHQFVDLTNTLAADVRAH